MSLLRTFFCLLLVCQPALAETIRVAAAISLKEAMSDIAGPYENATKDKLEFSFGSSGQLMMQVTAGAEIDVFLSAAAKQMDDLDKQKLIVPSTRRTIASNAMVLVVPADANAPATFAALVESDVRQVAIGEPKTVPAGQYAQQVFEALKLSAGVESKLVFGTNVRQVLAYVERGEVSAGVVYATDARQSDKVKVVATADPDTHEPIVYPGAVVASTKHREAAGRFLDYLTDKKGQAALRARGFVVDGKPTTRPAGK